MRRDRDRLHPRQHALDEGLAAHAGGRVGRSMQTVEQLVRGHDADPAIFALGDGIELRSAPLDVDGGLTCRSGRPRAARWAERGAALLDVACEVVVHRRQGGHQLVPLRRRIAGRARAGRSSAIGLPLRTISISSPAPTRLITREKLRATSVAVSRTMR